MAKTQASVVKSKQVEKDERLIALKNIRQSGTRITTIIASFYGGIWFAIYLLYQDILELLGAAGAYTLLVGCIVTIHILLIVYLIRTISFNRAARLYLRGGGKFESAEKVMRDNLSDIQAFLIGGVSSMFFAVWLASSQVKDIPYGKTELMTLLIISVVGFAFIGIGYFLQSSALNGLNTDFLINEVEKPKRTSLEDLEIDA